MGYEQEKGAKRTHGGLTVLIGGFHKDDAIALVIVDDVVLQDDTGHHIQFISKVLRKTVKQG